jgi:hypothetical protein
LFRRSSSMIRASKRWRLKSAVWGGLTFTRRFAGRFPPVSMDTAMMM